MTGETAVQPRLRLAKTVGRGSIWAGIAWQAQTPGHETMQQGHRYLRPDRSRAIGAAQRTLAPGRIRRRVSHQPQHDGPSRSLSAHVRPFTPAASGEPGRVRASAGPLRDPAGHAARRRPARVPANDPSGEHGDRSWRGSRTAPPAHTRPGLRLGELRDEQVRTRAVRTHRPLRFRSPACRRDSRERPGRVEGARLCHVAVRLRFSDRATPPGSALCGGPESVVRDCSNHCAMAMAI